MTRTIILYGISLAVLAAILKLLEYRFFKSDISLEIYIGLTAILFTVLGAWMGNRLLSKKLAVTTVSFESDAVELNKTGLSPREHEVLSLMAEGCSNQEIADKLFVSLSTVKTHSASIYMKLEVKRRTKPIQKTKELKIITIKNHNKIKYDFSLKLNL